MADGGKVLKWVGLGCGVLLLLGMCIGGGVFIAVRATSAPTDASAAFFGDLRRGDHQRALQRMNGPYQSSHPLPTFQQSVAALPTLTQQTGASFNSVNVSNNTATVQGSLETPGGAIPVTLTLSQIGDHWYIDSVTVQGQLLP